ncbi:transposase, partial [Thermodesulfatator autotrophicus]|uniref:transposase n=1 Tax=Thermodesulfatator autotrophicus TaxID=1795632 RepID=UPI0009EE287C
FVSLYILPHNHFHLLCRMLPENQFSDEEVKQRVKLYYGPKRKIFFYEELIKKWRTKLGNLSRYVQEIKQRFSRWYNRRVDRKGYFWADRFKSVIIETGEALLNCLAYIELNPVRAGIVERPENYRWCSLGYRSRRGTGKNFLSLNLGLSRWENKSEKEKLELLREFVYGKGGLGEPERGTGEIFRQRVRHFTESLAIGSKYFIEKAALKLKIFLGLKQKKKGKKITNKEMEILAL